MGGNIGRKFRGTRGVFSERIPTLVLDKLMLVKIHAIQRSVCAKISTSTLRSEYFMHSDRFLSLCTVMLWNECIVYLGDDCLSARR